MLKSFFWNRQWALWAWGGGLFLLVSLYAQVHMTVLINDWYGQFYNLLQNALSYKDNVDVGVGLFYDNIRKFFYIAMPYVLLATITGYFTRLYGFMWRKAMTFGYIVEWIKIKDDIEGSSQRIQEDCYRFARIVESLGLQTVRAIMTVIAFLPILWNLSASVGIEWIRNIPGSLVWLALLVSIGGLVVSWFVGWFLPGLEYQNQKQEAKFRKELVFGENDKVNYCDIETLTKLFTGVEFNYRRLFLHYSYFDIWSSLYEQFMVIVPYLVMGTGLFSGLITLGVMVQVSNAFQKVHGAFSLPIQNWTTVTELRSIHKRLQEFQDNITNQLKYKER